MILVWHDACSFKRHLEDMRNFRKSHRARPPCKVPLLKNLPVVDEVRPPNYRGIFNFHNVNGKMIIVPIWDIEVAQNSHN
jgi:hypothetical protein